MGQRWEDYDKAVEKGPFALAVKCGCGFVMLAVLFGGVFYVLGWFGEAAQVAKEEFGPRELLRKYEWFKDAAATLEKKKADVEVYESRVTSMQKSYGTVERSKWAKEDREQINVWASEVAGVKASFNSLAAEYNAQMAKFNWRFTNAGDLPKGASVPLPREFKAYIEK
jgi:hypothetical protein